jgi:HEAT repeat protein
MRPTMGRQITAVVVVVAGLFDGGNLSGAADHPKVPSRYHGRSAEEWIEDLTKPDPEARGKAAAALGNLGPHAVAAVPALVKALQDDDATVYSKAIFALARAGKPAVPALIEALKSENSQVREGAAEVLGEIGKDAKTAVPQLKDLLKDNAPHVRVQAAMALYRAEYRPAAMIALLAGAAKQNDTGRLGAIRSLGKIGPAAKRAVPVLAEALKNKSISVRDFAARALEHIGPGAEKAVPALTVALKDPEALVRMTSVWALDAIGPGAKAAVPALKELTRDKDLAFRMRATQALWSVERQPDLPLRIYQEALRSKDPQERGFAAIGLGRMGSHAAKEVPTLKRFLQDKDVRLHAAEALWRIESKPAITFDVLIPALRDPDPSTRGYVARLLGEMGAQAKPAIPDLLRATGDEEWSVRSDAATALKKIDPKALPKSEK